MSVDGLRDRAVAAAVATAWELGVTVRDPRVLSARGNVLIHLRPSPVVARVATLTAFTRADPAAWLGREVAVAETGTAAGGPVVAPAPGLDPGPHRRDGLALTLWEHRSLDGRSPAPREVGECLAALHEAAAGHVGELPFLAPALDQVREALALLRPARSVDALAERHAVVVADLPGPDPATDVVLHGDAHPGNLLHAVHTGPAARDGWVWTDLEETCRGPVLWDLAVLAGSARVDGGAAVRAWAAVSGSPVPTTAELAPFAAARRIEAAAWALGMAAVDPDRYAARAAELVTAALR